MCVCVLRVFVLFYFLRETKKDKVRLLSKWGEGPEGTEKRKT